MKIIGLTRIRNEGRIIKDTLDHLASFCDYVYIFDDASEDNTLEICSQHHIVKEIIQNKEWKFNRIEEEYKNRQELLNLAKKNCDENDWLIYIDADERIEFDWNKLISKKYNAIRMKLFDYYITPEDTEKQYYERKWIGPEYRKIVIAFKYSPELIYNTPDQREVILPKKRKVLDDGYVKHYGKAISIDIWEETCDYYITHFEKYADKWKLRKGKAVHTKSDFSNELIQWHEKTSKGFLLSQEEKYSKFTTLLNKLSLKISNYK